MSNELFFLVNESYLQLCVTFLRTLSSAQKIFSQLILLIFLLFPIGTPFLRILPSAQKIFSQLILLIFLIFPIGTPFLRILPSAQKIFSQLILLIFLLFPTPSTKITFINHEIFLQFFRPTCEIFFSHMNCWVSKQCKMVPGVHF